MNRHLTHILEQQSTQQSTRGMGWQQEQLPQQQQLNFMINDNNNHMNMFNLPIQGGIKQGTNMEILWDAYGVEDMNSSIPRTISCPPAVAAAMAEAAMGRSIEGICMANFGSGGGNESMKKRKLDRTQSLKVKEKVETKDKRMKECIEDVGAKMMTEKQSTSFNSNMEPSADNSQENSKVSEIKKQDFIHVRARRGQATDSHSLAERVRREKISERMKFLQDLVPGCNKIIGKAGMLDEIINYVQSLQRQVEFLSMKLSTVNPKIDYDIENLLNEEATPATTHGFSSIGLPSSMANPDNLQFNSLPVPCSGPEANDSQDLALRRTISAPVSLPETLLNQSYLNLNQIQHAPAWDVDLENLYVMEFQQDKLSPSFTPPFTGYTEANQVKLEM